MPKERVNLLLNGAFEQGLKHWECRRGEEGYCQEVPGPSIYLRSPASISQLIAVQGNRTYQMTWMTRQHGIPLCPVAPIITKENDEHLNQSFLERQLNRPIQYHFDPSTMRGSLTFTTPSDVTRVRVWLFCQEGDGQAYVEEICVELQE